MHTPTLLTPHNTCENKLTHIRASEHYSRSNCITHTPRHTDTHMCMHTHTETCVYMHAHTHACAHLHWHTESIHWRETCTHTYTQTHTHMHTCMCTYIHTHTQMYTNTHTYTDTQSDSLLCRQWHCTPSPPSLHPHTHTDCQFTVQQVRLANTSMSKHTALVVILQFFSRRGAGYTVDINAQRLLIHSTQTLHFF